MSISCEPGDVSSGSSQAGDKALAHRVVCSLPSLWELSAFLFVAALCDARSRVREDDIDRQSNKLRRERWERAGVASREPEFKENVAPFDIAMIAQTLAERVKDRRAISLGRA